MYSPLGELEPPIGMLCAPRRLNPSLHESSDTSRKGSGSPEGLGAMGQEHPQVQMQMVRSEGGMEVLLRLG